SLYLALGRLYSTEQNDVDAIDYIRRSKAAAEEVDDKHIIAEGNILLGITLAKSQQYKEALEAYTHSAQYSYETNNTRRLGAIFFLITQLHHHAEQFEAAYEACKLAIQYFTESGNKRGMLVSTTRMASIQSAFKNYEQALELLSENESAVTQLALPYISCGFYSIKAEILLAMGDMDECERTLAFTYPFATESSNLRNQLDLDAISIGLYLATGRIEKARELLEKALELARQFNDKHWEMKLAKLESDLYAKTGDTARALESYIRYHDQEKKITKEATEEQMRIMRFNHELAEKERESEIYRLRSEKLQRELVSKSTHLASESEILTRFREELKEVLSESTEASVILRKIKEKVIEIPMSAVNWEEFDRHFHDAHPDFTKNLLERFPELTPMEAKICTLLKVALTSKEIAHILVLSERSVENHRYRLRKKMGLGEQNISQFLNSLET
ncbi:MAG TPA: LuxR C-terminal-related transcriptional regulator, partial [Candidatus Kapabacteria bacterium]